MYTLEGPTAFWGNIWVFLKNFVKYLRYVQVKFNNIRRCLDVFQRMPTYGTVLETFKPISNVPLAYVSVYQRASV